MKVGLRRTKTRGADPGRVGGLNRSGACLPRLGRKSERVVRQSQHGGREREGEGVVRRGGRKLVDRMTTSWTVAAEVGGGPFRSIGFSSLGPRHNDPNGAVRRQ